MKCNKKVRERTGKLRRREKRGGGIVSSASSSTSTISINNFNTEDSVDKKKIKINKQNLKIKRNIFARKK